MATRRGYRHVGAVGTWAGASKCQAQETGRVYRPEEYAVTPGEITDVLSAVCVLPPQSAPHQHDLRPGDVVTEPPPAHTKAMLALAWDNTVKLLNGVLSGSVVGVLAENRERCCELSTEHVRMLLPESAGKAVKVTGCPDGEPRRHARAGFRALRGGRVSRASAARSSARSSSAGRVFPAREFLWLAAMWRLMYGSCRSR